MSRRTVVAALVALAGLLAVAACGGGGGPSTATSSPGPASGATPASVTQTARPSGTAGPGESPAPSGTPRPTAPSGAAAIAPVDQAAFLAKFAGGTIDYADCVFDPATSATDCQENGTYRIDPVPKGQDISCRVGLVEGAPVLINCTSQEPAQSIYYEIKG